MNWNQLRTVLLLRWQLTRNQWARSKYGIGPAISFLIGIAACILAVIAFSAGLTIGAVVLKNMPSSAVMLAWLGLVGAFLFFWAIGLLVEIQRAETIDLQRLMHLPVRLGQIFLINYVASHFALSLILVVPAAIGLAVGLTIVRGPLMLLLLPLVLSMIFMITAWTYCLRGWLTALMNNPRRRRSIIVLLTFFFVLIAQGPNLYFNVFGRARSRGGVLRRDLHTIESVQKFVPPFWVSLGARSLAEDDPWPAVLGTIGCAFLGTVGLHRAYRTTLSFYHSDASQRIEPGDATESPKKPRRIKAGAQLLEMQLPGVTNEASAIALASLRSMLRAPEVKMAWLMAFLITVIVGASILFRASANIPDNLKPFVALGATTFSLFVLFQQLGNLFGFDRDGFATYVLSPVSRAMILFGKNISILPVISCSGFMILILVTIWLHLPMLTAVATLFQIATMAIIACIFGNLLSILIPYRIQPGSLKPTKLPPGTALLMVVCQFLFPVALLPIFAPPLIELACRSAGMPGAAAVNPVLSILFLAVVVGIYWILLTPMGQLLQRRETKILRTVTAEVE